MDLERTSFPIIPIWLSLGSEIAKELLIDDAIFFATSGLKLLGVLFSCHLAGCVEKLAVKNKKTASCVPNTSGFNYELGVVNSLTSPSFCLANCEVFFCELA